MKGNTCGRECTQEKVREDSRLTWFLLKMETLRSQNVEDARVPANFPSLPGDGYSPTNIIFLKMKTFMLLKIKWVFFVHCLICYLKASKKHILNCN